MFVLCDGGSAHGEHGDGGGSISGKKGVGNECMGPQWAMAENRGGSLKCSEMLVHLVDMDVLESSTSLAARSPSYALLIVCTCHWGGQEESSTLETGRACYLQAMVTVS